MPPPEKAPPSDPAVPETQAYRDGADQVPLTADRRAELLALADENDLVELAERCLQAAADDASDDAPDDASDDAPDDGSDDAPDDASHTTVIEPPTVGTIPLCVREPVVGERFILADVLATQAEVEHRAHRGWAMRLGDDTTATLAAAICDAEAASGAGLAGEVELLCRRTERNLADRAASEWEQLVRTEVRFEELI
jgi:alpha-D-ribose 1-methylphosphonate 5-triphosphate synthase subunit PhnG